ncbi:MAG: toprim domain-containing protein, partial [Anaerolineales bacterium]|nr:toprim domain-containing protein [Anaerolineales bacterium]
RFVQLYRRCSFVEAFKEVCGKDVTVSSIYAKLKKENAEVKSAEAEEREYDIALPSGSLPIIDHKDTLNGRMLVSWLASRGVGEDMIAQYRLHFHSMHVVWPYYEYGSLVYWQERNCLNKVFRFPSESVGVTKGMFLYGFDMVEPGDYVVVTEAIFDSHTLGAQTVASGGAILTDKQVHRLRALNPTNGVVLAPDNDAAGVKSIISNYELLHPYFKKIFYALPPKLKYGDDQVATDWNDIGRHKIMPWPQIRTTFEKCIKPLTRSDVVRFMLKPATI